MVHVAYCKKKKVPDMPGMEIDIQTFFTVMLDMYMAIAEKKLLRSVILLSFVSFKAINTVVWRTQKI
jgi:hypothetical protein